MAYYNHLGAMVINDFIPYESANKIWDCLV